jgi:hypothetical protein
VEIALPAAELRGIVRSKPRPATLSVRFEESAVECPVDEASGQWRCRLPRAKLDLRIAAEDSAPLYFWGVDLTPGRVDLGDVTFVEGASVAGWISSDRRGFDLRAATVKLVPEGYGHEDDSDSLRSYTTRANERGFFQFGDVFPGTYAVVAEASGMSPGRRSGLAVEEGRERVLQHAVALREMARLEVLISPPLAPDGRPWRVRLTRTVPDTGLLMPVEERAAGEDGMWRSGSLHASPHLIDVQDARGATFESQRVEIEPGMAMLPIAIASVSVKGTLTLGEDPLEAELRFSNQSGQEIELKADDRGTFGGVLPKEGTWDVTVAVTKPRQEILIRDVVIRRRDGHEHARVDLELSGRRVRGRLVDEHGDAVRGGVQLLRELVPENGTRSEDDGTFELLGVAPGRIALTGFSEERQSQTEELFVGEKKDPEPVTLVVERERQIAAVVTTSSGFPVAGARIHYLLQGGLPGSDYTSPSGRFHVRVPRSTASVALAILAPGLPAKITTLDVSSARTQGVTLDDQGGVLQLRNGGAPPWPWILHDGATFNFVTLLSPPSGNGPPHWLRPGGIFIDIEPGTYTLCPDPRLSDTCITKTIAPGATALFDTTSWWPGVERPKKEASQ